MATMAVTSPLGLYPNKPSKLTSCLSSSTSVFFSYNSIELSRAALRVAGNRRGNDSNRRRRGLSCNCLFGLGVPELVVIAGVVALVFGPKKLPEVGRSIGKTVKSFQQAAKEFESELKKDGEPLSAEASSGENITTAVSEEKQEDKAPSTKETS